MIGLGLNMVGVNISKVVKGTMVRDIMGRIGIVESTVTTGIPGTELADRSTGTDFTINWEGGNTQVYGLWDFYSGFICPVPDGGDYET